MSAVAQSALYQEQVRQATPRNAIDRALEELVESKPRLTAGSLVERIRLAEACAAGVMRVCDRWIAAACAAKGLPRSAPPEGEELAAGPMATLRYLRMLVATLHDVEQTGKPRLPGAVATLANGQLSVQVFPARGLFDSILFQGFRADVWMRPGVTRDNLRDHMATRLRDGEKSAGAALVLGAGNVASIAPTDAFSRIFQEGKVVLLKMNPVNEYLGPIFTDAFAPLIDSGYLRIVYGGADTGAYCVDHELVDEAHITGSIFSHEAIVWGPPGEERERRKAEAAPRLQKGITSELGNVTPWIVVPARYSDKELAFQAENVAAMIVNNASFNCIAVKMIVTSRSWPQRAQFLDKLSGVLAKVPPRKAYYPGAAERFRRFAGVEAGEAPAGSLPWTLRRDVDPDRDAVLFDEESFVCVAGETALDCSNTAEFLDAAPRFVNNKLWGNLGAGVMVRHSDRHGEHAARFQAFLQQLRYGTIGVNQWPAIGYALMCTPWGGFPEGTLADPRSGIGWVHNTFLLDDAERTVVEGPLCQWPKPFWFPTHRTAHVLARKTLDLYDRPSLWKLPGLMLPALRG